MSHKEIGHSTQPRVSQTRGTRYRSTLDSATLATGEKWTTSTDRGKNGRERIENGTERGLRIGTANVR